MVYYADILNDTRLMSEPGWLEMSEKTQHPFLFFPLHLILGARHRELQELSVFQIPAGMFLLVQGVIFFSFCKTIEKYMGQRLAKEDFEPEYNDVTLLIWHISHLFPE